MPHSKEMAVVEKFNFKIRENKILALPLSSCVTLGKLFTFL